MAAYPMSAADQWTNQWSATAGLENADGGARNVQLKSPYASDVMNLSPLLAKAGMSGSTMQDLSGYSLGMRQTNGYGFDTNTEGLIDPTGKTVSSVDYAVHPSWTGEDWKSLGSFVLGAAGGAYAGMYAGAGATAETTGATLASDSATKAALYGAEGYGAGMTGAETAAYGSGVGATAGTAAQSASVNSAGTGLGANAAPAVEGSAITPTATSTAANAAKAGTMDWTSLIGPGLNFVGSYMNAGAAKDAASAQSDAALQAAAIQAAQRQPWVDAGKAALPQLAAGVAPGGQFNKPFTMADAQNSDAEKYALASGKRAVENSAAAKSGLLNSNAIEQGVKTAEDISSSFQNQAFNQNLATNNMALTGLESLSGTGISQAGQVADAAGNAALVAGGANAASGLASANIWSNYLSNTANQQQTMAALKSLFSGSGASNPAAMDSSGVGPVNPYTYPGP